MLFRNIPLGIYYPGGSIAHRLQARTKLLTLLWLIIVLILASRRVWHFAPYLVDVGLAFVGLALARIPPAEVWRRLGFLIVIVIISSLLSLFTFGAVDQKVLYTLAPLTNSYATLREILLMSGGVLLMLFLSSLLPPLRPLWRQRRLKVLKGLIVIMLVGITLCYLLTMRFPPAQSFVLGPFFITYSNVWALVSGFVVLLVLFIFSLLLTMTTLPIALVEGMTLLLAPLRRLKLPVDDFALMTLLALRFIPTLFDEAEGLMKAQVARGSDVSYGSLRERVQSLAMFFTPLIEGTLRRASELATALEARGYRATGRQTLLHETTLGPLDYTVLGVVVVVTAGSLLL